MGTGPSSAPRRPTPNRPGIKSRRNTNGIEIANGEGRYEPVYTMGRLHSVVHTDVAMSARYGSQAQRRMRTDLYGMMRDVVQYAGFQLESLPMTDTGDGIRFLLPADLVQPVHVVDMFVLGLRARLREHRQAVSEAARIRLRVAFDFGLIERHLQGWTGDPLIRVARLVEAGPLRAALRDDASADLVAVVSDFLYETVIRHGYGYIGPSCFRAIRVSVKEFDARAWQLISGMGMCGQCPGVAA